MVIIYTERNMTFMMRFWRIWELLAQTIVRVRGRSTLITIIVMCLGAMFRVVQVELRVV